ncbi:MAG: S41 family peptidase [Muribaculaceae bacterium]
MKKFIFLIIIAITTGSFLAGGQYFRNLTPEQRISLTAEIIDNYYVEGVDMDSIADQAIIAMLAALDPHSKFSTAEETRELNQPLEGKFFGIGIQFNLLEDTIYIIQTTPGGPCARAGVLPGDRIISANDTLLAGQHFTNSDVIRRLRGPKDSKVTIEVKREGFDELLPFDLTRAEIPLYSVDASYMVDKNVGYISISRFAETTDKEVCQAADSLLNCGMKHLIIDLSSNGGGYLQAAVDLANEFLCKGDPIVFTRGQHSPERHYTATSNGSLRKIDRLVVIVDQYSASAAEIFAGAVQDNDRGVVVGRRTFGKGLVQRPFPFPDGSMIRLTTARYYTPSGRCIQKPYVKGQGEEYQLDMLNRFNSGELWCADSIHLDTTETFYTLRNHRPVYGGGGIMPDVFVPVDTSRVSPFYRQISAKSIIIKSVFKFIEQNREQILAQYPNEAAFAQNFIIPDELDQDILNRAAEAEIEFSQEDWERSKELIHAITLGLLTRDIFTNGIYVRATNPLNPDFIEALSLINDPDRYKHILRNQPITAGATYSSQKTNK